MCIFPGIGCRGRISSRPYHWCLGIKLQQMRAFNPYNCCGVRQVGMWLVKGWQSFYPRVFACAIDPNEVFIKGSGLDGATKGPSIQKATWTYPAL